METLSQDFNSKIDRLQDTQEDFMKMEKASDRHLKNYIQQSERQMNSRLNSMEEKLDRVLLAIHKMGGTNIGNE